MCADDVNQLPWATSNDDLVELFTTIGKVERGEIQYEPNGRSKGTGVVQFDSADAAEEAISMFQPGLRLANFAMASCSIYLERLLTDWIDKFSGYIYGGRPLGLSFVKYVTGDGSGDDAMDAEGTGGMTQDQMM